MDLVSCQAAICSFAAVSEQIDLEKKLCPSGQEVRVVRQHVVGGR
jgi:hypothetical protein